MNQSYVNHEEQPEGRPHASASAADVQVQVSPGSATAVLPLGLGSVEPSPVQASSSDVALSGHVLRLANELARIGARLNDVWDEVQESGQHLAALIGHLTNPQANQALEERLADLLTRQEASQQQLEELIQTVSRLGRTQFRANALSESREQQIANALTTLREIVTRREKVQEARALQEEQRLAELRAEARGELMADLLPVLDGLELALESGQAFLEQRQRRKAQEAAERAARSQAAPLSRGVWQKLRDALTSAGTGGGAGRGLSPSPAHSAREEDDETVEVLTGWLQGLELVQDRFLRLLAAEGIQAIPALGHAFDPHRHLAVATELRDDVPPGTVVSVRRKGYCQRKRVLRYAEVVVSKTARPVDAQPMGSSGDGELAAGETQESGEELSEMPPLVQS